ncbi:MAG TPA: hemerythrin family protein [Desulfuromonadales bacterium]|nr:hemerythrin family protein [Desulfuromonadales bacterium]
MTGLEWDDSYSVGVEVFDEHHRHLFDLLNKSYQICLVNNQTDLLKSVIHELIEYVHYHFEAEESYLKQIRHPELEAHITEHTHFTDKIAEMNLELHQSGAVNLLNYVDFTDFLAKWIQSHVKEVDKRYSPK